MEINQVKFNIEVDINPPISIEFYNELQKAVARCEEDARLFLEAAVRDAMRHTDKSEI